MVLALASWSPADAHQDAILRLVLQQTREAIIELAAAQQGIISGLTVHQLGELVGYLKRTGDRESVRRPDGGSRARA